MIDIENIVFDHLYTAVTTVSPDANVISETVEEMAKFPAVTVQEINNITYTKSNTEKAEEHNAIVTYEINVYSDKQKQNKSECKKIMKAVDAEMLSMGFYRILTTRLPDVDRTIYRIYARYRGIVDTGTTDDDGNTVYRIYRK